VSTFLACNHNFCSTSAYFAEKNALTLLSPPHAIADFLTSDHLLGPNVDIKVKHGVIGLLKNLSQGCTQSFQIASALTDAGVVRKLGCSKVWAEDNDPMAEVVQVRAIGVVKNLCNANGMIQRSLPVAPF
jgi:hypothetical protein